MFLALCFAKLYRVFMTAYQYPNIENVFRRKCPDRVQHSSTIVMLAVGLFQMIAAGNWSIP